MFFGREEQIGQLASLWDKRVSSLVTCRGRRRVGKSTLVEEIKGKDPIDGVVFARKHADFGKIA